MTKQDFKRIAEEIRISLKDFTPPPKNEPTLAYSGKGLQFNVDRTDIPVPGLIYFILGGILKLPVYGPEEKLRWEIPFRYKGIHCAFALQKFGLRLYVSHSDNLPMAMDKISREIIGKIKKTIQRIEKRLLNPFAKYQIQNGNVTIANQYHRLENRFSYFREKAEKASKRRKKVKGKDFIEEINKSVQYVYRSKSELFYNTIAMLDAYFSLLEHLFVLVIPLYCDNVDLIKFISDYWSVKFTTLFNIKTDSKAKSFYDRLDDIKERYRNFYAHGGFEKGGASLYIHFPDIGAIPAQLTNIRNSPHFDFFPIHEEKLKEICRTIDEFNGFLRSEDSGLKSALRYIESGLDIPCDKTSIGEIRAAMKSEKALNALIEHYSYLDAMHTNMDY